MNQGDSMNIRYIEFTEGVEELVQFLTSDHWTYHGVSNPDPNKIRTSYEDGFYSNDESKTFWIVADDHHKVGMIRLFDLLDSTPLFDIRILSGYRGQGIGEDAVKWLTHHLFTQYPDKSRVEGHTRQDNYAMRTVFHKCGYVKEAYHRKAWRSQQEGKDYDSVGYAITKEDWENGTLTPIDWNDFKY